MNQHVRFYPDIDYRNHPAFRELGVPTRNDESVVDSMIETIDRGLEALHKVYYADAAALQSAFDAGPGRRIVELGAYLDQTTPNERVRALLARSIPDVIVELKDEARIKNDRHHFNRKLSIEGRRVSNDLERDGAHICRITDAERAKLWNLCLPAIKRLRAAAALDPKGRVAESFARYSALGVHLDSFFRRSAVLEGLAHYFGSNVIFAGFALEYNHSKQTWWEGLYADVGLPSPKTAYLHYDHGCRNPKAIVALSEVSEDNGPTSYIMGSPRKVRSNFVHFMVKSIEYAFRDDDLGSENPAYRRMFQEVRYRREFLMLPRALQGSSHFGEDVIDGTPLSADLLQNEVKITRDVGNCVVFDGDYGIHRGALVRSGERFVFQVIFAIEPDLPKGNALYNRARAIARRLVKGD